MIKDPLNISDLVTRIYSRDYVLADGQPLSRIQFLEHFHKLRPVKYQGFQFYIAVLYHAAGNKQWGREVCPDIYEWFFDYCTTKIKKKPKKIEAGSFESYLTEKGKQHKGKLVSIYHSQKGKHVAMGLLAMYELNLLNTDPRYTNQAALCRALTAALGVKNDPRALLMNEYANEKNPVYQDEIKKHSVEIMFAIS